MEAKKAPKFLSVGQVAAEIGVTGSVVRQLVVDGRLTAIRLPSGRLRIDAGQVPALVESLRQAAAAYAGNRRAL